MIQKQGIEIFILLKKKTSKFNNIIEIVQKNFQCDFEKGTFSTIIFFSFYIY